MFKEILSLIARFADPARASMRSAGIQMRQQKCASKQAKLRVSARSLQNVVDDANGCGLDFGNLTKYALMSGRISPCPEPYCTPPDRPGDNVST